MTADLAARAAHLGIERSYRDAWGERREVPEATIERLMATLQASALPPPHHASAQCFEPEWVRRGERLWGVSVQLYGLRSPRNWGIGDFGDLKRLLELVASVGGDFVAVNPLHAMFAAAPDWISPYSPSSREFLNVLYIEVPAMLGYVPGGAAERLVSSTRFKRKLQALRRADLVNYPGITECKRMAFRAVFTDFQRTCAAVPKNTAALAFADFRHTRGGALQRFALYQALSCRSGFGPDWRTWPERFRDPTSEAVTAFADEHASEISYHCFLQWEADIQLARCSEAVAKSAMRLGLCLDLAVGTGPMSSETWARQEGLIAGFYIGAPPDQWNERGQDWGLVASDPAHLATADYAAFRRVLAANMRHAQALRIDHILGLNRLFLVPAGGRALDGTYLRYPAEALADVVASESKRHRCVIIGEDLGTVPEGMRHLLETHDILSFRLLMFGTDHTGQFVAPETYPVRAIVAFSTHDLPTFGGYWSGRDLDMRRKLGLFRSAAAQEAAYTQREQDRHRLLAALRTIEPQMGSAEASVLAALFKFLARTPCRLLQLQLEDLAGEYDQPNLPGTRTEYPNWRRKLGIELEEIFDSDRVQALLSVVRAERFDARRPPP